MSGGSLDEAPSIKIVDFLLEHAVACEASDIHLEPSEHGLRVRFRCDGFLVEKVSVLAEHAAHVIARIKVLAALDIAEKRMPQDGKFKIQGSHAEIDLRVATFPSLYGEKIVIRLLDHARQKSTLYELGLSHELLSHVRALTHRAHGFFIVTGPTGSGKTTTLYALLKELRSKEKNIITLEDPIEYTIAGTTQGQVNGEIGFDFARGIRALLRQDPDIIMVGEMRDTETAQTAIQAALTGHFVLSTLHTADAPGALIRLLDMGIPAFLMNAAITGILAQRLVRKLCDSCKQEAPLSDQEERYCAERNIELLRVYKPVGCARCYGSGYRGRIGIFELFTLTPSLRALMHDRMQHDDLIDAARREGMQPLSVDAAQKIQAGVTSLSELMRVMS